MVQGPDERQAVEEKVGSHSIQQTEDVETTPVAPTPHEFGLDPKNSGFMRETGQKQAHGLASRDDKSFAGGEPEECQGFGGQSPQKHRALGPNDTLLLTIRDGGSACHGSTSSETSSINVPDVVATSIAESPAIQLGDPTLSMVNEFIDYEAVEKQKRLKNRSFWRRVWRVLTCDFC